MPDLGSANAGQWAAIPGWLVDMIMSVVDSSSKSPARPWGDAPVASSDSGHALEPDMPDLDNTLRGKFSEVADTEIIAHTEDDNYLTILSSLQQSNAFSDSRRSLLDLAHSAYHLRVRHAVFDGIPVHKMDPRSDLAYEPELSWVPTGLFEFCEDGNGGILDPVRAALGKVFDSR